MQNTGENLEGLDGFFCGLAVSPELVMPSEWLPLVWGDEERPAFEFEEQAERILGLIMRHWNSVNRAVRLRPDHDALFYMPLMFEPEGDPQSSQLNDLTGYAQAL